MDTNCRKTGQRRRGASAVEAVLVSPILVLILLGAIDIGQYVNVAQTVSNTSRETARFACRHDTLTKSSVTNYARDYLQSTFPTLTQAEITAALTINVKNHATGQEITDLTDVPSSEAISVRISFDFSAVRWLKNIDYWDLQSGGVTTVVRRE